MIDKDTIEQHVQQWKRPTQSELSHCPQYNTSFVTRDSETPCRMFSDMLLQMLLDQFKKQLKHDFRDDWHCLSVQRYDAGDYIPPHFDTWDWHRLLVLTSSEYDGLVLENKQTERFEFHQDRAGNMITIEPYTQHWVNPVRQAPRYTAVLACA